MNKFKVEDKVLYENKSYTITAINKIENKKDIVKLNDSTFVYGYGNLRPYITPHQELLDLGFSYVREDNNFIKYIQKSNSGKETIVIINIEEKTYFWECNYGIFNNLKLSKILTRYLEELRWQ